MLLMNKDDGSQTKLDDSYFLWSISFFLKFARRKELNVEFKNIKYVLMQVVAVLAECQIRCVK